MQSIVLLFQKMITELNIYTTDPTETNMPAMTRRLHSQVLRMLRLRGWGRRRNIHWSRHAAVWHTSALANFLMLTDSVFTRSSGATTTKRKGTLLDLWSINLSGGACCITLLRQLGREHQCARLCGWPPSVTVTPHSLPTRSFTPALRAVLLCQSRRWAIQILSMIIIL